MVVITNAASPFPLSAYVGHNTLLPFPSISLEESVRRMGQWWQASSKASTSRQCDIKLECIQSARDFPLRRMQKCNLVSSLHPRAIYVPVQCFWNPAIAVTLLPNLWQKKEFCRNCSFSSRNCSSLPLIFGSPNQKQMGQWLRLIWNLFPSCSISTWNTTVCLHFAQPVLLISIHDIIESEDWEWTWKHFWTDKNGSHWDLALEWRGFVSWCEEQAWHPSLSSCCCCCCHFLSSVNVEKITSSTHLFAFPVARAASGN